MEKEREKMEKPTINTSIPEGVESSENHEVLSMKEVAQQIYTDIMSEPIWWPQEILDSLELTTIEDGFRMTSPQARNFAVGIAMRQGTYFLEVTEPNENTSGLAEKTSGMAHNQKKAEEVYKSLTKSNLDI